MRNSVWKLSPSDLTFLWYECKRCFYLKVKERFNRPWTPFPSIFGRIAYLTQAYYQGKHPSAISERLLPELSSSGSYCQYL